ncbi:hypothetical protein [Flavonifractor sp. An10]|uniref:hypothetical protein n=1 Tax=Flavonifractor sp. An10 TaxID=1965537 RepID=UPI000B3815A7|nr:hypothetical protein [Flavonifractor sp. An10]OUQ82733.1 hypothetical protein B5E42_08580 [Flavonifractor sp. An10]
MASYTTNYQLHQWEASDSFLRTDFNTDFQKIDAAVKGVETAANTALALKADKTELTQACGALDEAKCETLTGSYTGNGANTRTIDLGCAPRAVFVGEFLAVPGMTSNYLLSLTASGFQVRDSLGTSTNSSGETYYYLALV